MVELYAGISSAQLILAEHIGIKIVKCISVEADKVARCVGNYRRIQKVNERYCCNENDYEAYENTSKVNSKGFWKRKIDLWQKEGSSSEGLPIVILGGPPCQEHSGQNAWRRGIHSASGNEIIVFCDIVNWIREECDSKGIEVYFMMEMVKLQERTKRSVEERLGVKVVCYPAHTFHRRDACDCITNIVPDEPMQLFNQVFPSDCLDQEFKQITFNPKDAYPDLYHRMKCPSFQASKSRMTKRSHYKFRHSLMRSPPALFNKGPGKNNGFPEGYVKDPVDSYFLQKAGYLHEFVRAMATWCRSNCLRLV